MAEVKWIKIVTDVFDDEKIRFIETMPQGDTIIVLWFKLLCMCGKSNQGGFLMMTNKIAYTDDLLSSIFNRDIKLVKLALDTFLNLEMIEIIDNKYYISNWEKHQNIDKLQQIRENTRLRVANHREKQKQLECNVTVTQNVTQCNALDKEEDIDKDIDINNTIDDCLTLFELFWNAYPRKESKEKTKSWFKKNKPNEKLFNQIMDSLEKIKKTKQWQDKQFIPHPTTWLNQKRWEDEIKVDGTTYQNNKKVASTPEWYEDYEKQIKEHNKKQEVNYTEEELEKILAEVKDFDTVEVRG